MTVKPFHRCLVCDYVHPDHDEQCPIPELVAKIRKRKGET